MRIALDARTLISRDTGDDAGAAEARWADLARVTGWEIVAYTDDLEAARRPALTQEWSWRCLPASRGNFDAWSQVRLPFAAWRERADVIVTANLNCPALRPCPVVTLIDHLNPIEAPRGLTVADVSRFEQRVRVTCRRASHIICPTAHLRDRLAAGFGACESNLSLAAPGRDESCQRVASNRWNEVLQRYDLSRPFVLHYGPDEPRRNTRRLIEAWAMSDLKIRQRMQLAIIGMSDATGDDLVKVVNRLGLAASVRLYRKLGDADDLSALLSAADIAAIPFTAAGFPIELLAAWATRSAVLTSDSGSIGEVAGDGALCVDPNDAGAIARGLGRMFRDARFRRELADRGQQRLQQFTRENAAEQLATAIERAIGTRTMRRPITDPKEPLRKAA